VDIWWMFMWGVGGECMVDVHVGGGCIVWVWWVCGCGG
jgi:hypothetical protein